MPKSLQPGNVMNRYSVLILLAFFSQPLQAGFVFDSGAGGAAGIESFVLSETNSTRYADSFLLPTTQNITSVDWAGTYFGNPPGTFDDFTLSFYADVANSPATSGPLVSFNVGNNVNRADSGFNILNTYRAYEFSADINFVALASTQYWLSISNDSSTSDVETFFWGLGNDPSRSIFGTSGNSWSSENLGPLDFRLSVTAVPEPSSMLLLILAGTFTVTRRLRQCRLA